ncbi:MAG TPA: hypothetical protein GX693_05645 [Firmicutes bacterium]|nr:hypothetical protein [Bacillota bacterium]
MDREKLEEKIWQEVCKNKLTCKSAHKIAADSGCSLAEIGLLCNRLKIKIVGCQLGCF